MNSQYNQRQSTGDSRIFRQININPKNLIGTEDIRSGAQYRDPLATIQHFGLRGISFGQMNDIDRVGMLYALAYSLTDLARAIGIPESDIGCHGRIGFAIGTNVASRFGAPCAQTPWLVVKVPHTEIGVLAYEYFRGLDYLISYLANAPDWVSGGNSTRHSINGALVNVADKSFTGLAERIFMKLFVEAPNRSTKYSLQLRDRELRFSRAMILARTFVRYVVVRIGSHINWFLLPKLPIGVRDLNYPPLDLITKVTPDLELFLRRTFALCREKPYTAEASPTQQHFQFEGRHTTPAPVPAPMASKTEATPIAPTAVPTSPVAKETPTTARGGTNVCKLPDEPASKPAPAVTTQSNVQTPISVAVLQDVSKRINVGEITAAEFKSTWHRYLASRQSLAAEYNTMTLEELGNFRHSSSERKPTVVQRAVNHIANIFLLGRSYSYNLVGGSSGGSWQEAIGKLVEATTDELLQEFAAALRGKKAEFKQQMTEPKTYDDFRQFVTYRGEEKLTPEQRIRWDELQADRARENAERDRDRQAVIKQADVDTEFKLIEGTHTKKGHKLYIVQMTSRVSPEQYKELNSKAKRLGGHYSSFVKSQSGFHFATMEAAQQFMALKEGDVSNVERVKERERQRELTASERLRELAIAMIDRAEDVLNQERKVNTWKRSNDAARVEGRAQSNKAMAGTLLRIAEAIESGATKYLDRIRFRTHVDSLDHILRVATIAAIRADGKSGHSEDEWNRPPEFSDIDHAEYPYPWIHRDNLKHLAEKGMKIPGNKLLSNRMMKYAMQHTGDRWRVRFTNDTAIADYNDFLSRLNQKDYDVMNAIHDESDYRHLQAMQIRTEPELRAALREYFRLRENKPAIDPIKKAERALVGRKIPDYFPTPQPIIEMMLQEADIESGMSVLEPSAGKGNIAVAIHAAYPGVMIDVIERDFDLRKILEQKGFNVVAWDFLQYTQKQYDRIIMNPPFSDEVAHVNHAYSLLKPGGRIVTIMSEGPFFRSERASQEFRQWLDSHKGTSLKLPAGSFKEGDVPTGVNTRLVVIDKAGDARSIAPTFKSEIIYGRKTTLETVEGEVSAQYAVMELDDVLASNDEHSFAPTVGYPHECQQRDYTTSKAEKEKVIRQAADLKPSFLLTDDPSAGNGPPMVKLLADKGITLGGNSRVMTLKRTSSNDFAKYKTMLLEKARNFGIHEQDIRTISRPILVRIIDVEMARCATMSRVLNQNLTQAIDATQETIALARELTEDDTQNIATAFEQSGEETFASAMARRNVADTIISVFEKHGIINRQNRPQWITSSGGLTGAGRDRVEETLLATILPSRKHIEYARSFTAKLLKTLPLMLRMKRMPADWNLVPSIVKAIELESEFQAAGDASEHAFQLFIKSGSLTRSAPSDKEVTVWKLLRGGIGRWQQFMASWVKNAENASGVTKDTSGFDFGEPAMTPEQLLAVAQKTAGLGDGVLADFVSQLLQHFGV